MRNSKQNSLIILILLLNVSTFSFSQIKEEVVQDNQIWNYYWTIISKADRGIDLKKEDMKVFKTGLCTQGVEFANKYLHYKKPKASQYAFIALRDVLDAADTERFSEDDYGEAKQNNEFRVRKIESEYAAYGAKVGDIDAATTHKGSDYLFEAKAMNDVGYEVIARNYGRFITQIEPNQTSVGWWRIGPTNQPYGRYARAFENASSRNRMYFDLNDQFLPQSTISTSVTIKIIYLDAGTGKFSFRYDAVTNPDKTAIVVTKTNSGKWVSKSITIADGEFANKGPRNSDFSLVNEDNEDDVFHLIEITKKNSIK